MRYWGKAMIDTSTLLLFLAAAWAMILVPGPDILYVLSRGMVGGRRAGIVSALGVGTGEVFHTLLVASGLAAILATSLTMFLIIQYLVQCIFCTLGSRRSAISTRSRFQELVRQLHSRTSIGKGC